MAGYAMIFLAGILWFGGAHAQVGPVPAGHSGSTSCVINFQGRGTTDSSLMYKIRALSIRCNTTDAYYARSGLVGMYAGQPMVDYQAANPSQFTGVKLHTPNEANFLGTNNQEASLFLVANGKLSLTGYVKDVYNYDWPAITIENGTNATFTNFDFANNKGSKFAALALSRTYSTLSKVNFRYNNCTVKNRCHSPALYVTEGARFSVDKCNFNNNNGHQAGGIMITSGAIGTVTNTNFTSNSVVNYGDWAGGIFHDFCTTPRALGQQSTFKNNRFLYNRAEGFGGAIKIGSPNGGCKPTISNNYFYKNSANLTGGAIFFTYCNGSRPTVISNNFVSNHADKFDGQIGYNSPANSAQAAGAKPSALCLQPTTPSCTFSTVPPKFSPSWYFP